MIVKSAETGKFLLIKITTLKISDPDSVGIKKGKFQSIPKCG